MAPWRFILSVVHVKPSIVQKQTNILYVFSTMKIYGGREWGPREREGVQSDT